ncbi:MAG: type II secretion system F family protein [Caulobacteraceae bacterium]
MPQFVVPMIYVLAFVAVFLLIQGLANLILSSSDQTKRVNRRLTMFASGMDRDSVYATLVRNPASIGGQGGALAEFHESLNLRLKQAGLAITPTQFASYVVMAGTGVWLLCVAIMILKGAPLLTSFLTALVLAAVFSAIGAWGWLNGRRKKRLKKLEEQLPLALDIVTRAIRAGHPVISAVQLASEELGDPIGSEFGLIVDETTYGLEFKEALASFARRTGSADVHFFAVSVGIQSETGGNLAEILEGLAGVVRGRQTLAKRVKALSSEGKASAWILSLLPLFLIGMMMLMAPTFYTSKFADPLFWPVVVAVMVVYAIGQVMIKRITDIKY